MGTSKAMGRVLFKPLGRSGLSIYDLAKLKKKGQQKAPTQKTPGTIDSAPKQAQQAPTQKQAIGADLPSVGHVSTPVLKLPKKPSVKAGAGKYVGGVLQPTRTRTRSAAKRMAGPLSKKGLLGFGIGGF